MIGDLNVNIRDGSSKPLESAPGTIEEISHNWCHSRTMGIWIGTLFQEELNKSPSWSQNPRVAFEAYFQLGTSQQGWRWLRVRSLCPKMTTMVLWKEMSGFAQIGQSDGVEFVTVAIFFSELVASN
jgi:hypothetical protein